MHTPLRSVSEQRAPVQLDLATVQTNIVVFHLPAAMVLDAPALSARAHASRACWSMRLAPRTVRAVTHLDVSRLRSVNAPPTCWLHC
jgi:threonine aldolase